jgi:F0F1-type ATP synthase delta subunit
MTLMLIVQFIVLNLIISGVILFFLHKTLIGTTQGAVKRLNNETEAARVKQAELNQKIKDANEELEKRKAEAEKLVKQMLEQGEEKSKEERQKIVNKARLEAEEVITKAQRTKDAVRKEIEKELQLKLIDEYAKVFNMILSEKASKIFCDHLIEEFINNLKGVDPSQVSPEVSSINVIAAVELSSNHRKEIEQVLNDKLKRPIKFVYQVDPKVVGGVALKFGSLVLDGSLKNIIQDTTVKLKQELNR